VIFPFQNFQSGIKSAGKHLFPFRTEQLSPFEPMIPSTTFLMIIEKVVLGKVG